MRIKFLFLFLFLSIRMLSQEMVIDVSNLDTNGVSVTKMLGYFIVEDGDNLFQQLDRLSLEGFQGVDDRVRLDLNDEKNIWLKFDLYNPSDTIVEVMFIYRQSLNMYFYLEERRGWTFLNQPEIAKENSTFGGTDRFVRIKLHPKARKSFMMFKTGYGKINIAGILKPLEAGLKEREETRQREYVANIFRMGFLFIAFSFSLFTFLQFFQHKDRSYLYYSIYLFAIFLVFLWRNSLYFGTPFSPFLQNNWSTFYGVNHYLLIFLYFLFFYSFINENHEGEGILKWIRVCCYVIIFALVLDVFLMQIGQFNIARSIFNIGMYPMILGYAVLLYKAWRLPDGPTRYLFWGTVILFVFAILERVKMGYFASRSSGGWNSYFDIMIVGFFIEILFFGLALSYRTKLLQEEKHLALKEKEFEAEKARLYRRITHEIRTPLSIIRGNANLILRRSKSIREEVGFINSNVSKLTLLVNDMLDLSKMQERKMKLEQVKGDIVAYLDHLVVSFRPLAIENKITLIFNANVKSWSVDYSEEALSQIVSNLISNALKFTPIHGEVKVRLEKDDNQILISVSDTGKGFTEIDKKKIFEPFYQVERKVENEVKGTGLGLSIIWNWVEMLKGKIEVQSELHKGTVFLIALPATYKAEISTKTKDWYLKDEDLDFSNEPVRVDSLGVLPLVLVVEDNLDLQVYYKKLLSPYYSIIAANNGEEGLQMAKEKQPMIIVADEMMPVRNGFEMLEDLKSIDEVAHIPVIMVTARIGRDDKLRGLELSAEAYLSKPVDEKELLLMLRNIQKRQEHLLVKGSLVRWKGHIVVEPFMRDALKVLESNHSNQPFKAFDLKYKLQKHNWGGERAVEKLIKKYFNKTTAKLIKSYRLEKARTLLRSDTPIPITEIISLIGLDTDRANFNRMYKDEFNVTPGNDRN